MNIKNKLSSILPDGEERDEIINEATEHIANRQNAKELTRLKNNAKARLKRAEEKAAAASDPTSSAPPTPPTPLTAKKVEDAKKALEAIEVLEARPQPLRVDKVAQVAMAQGQVVRPNTIKQALKLQGTSRAEVDALLKSLNINTSIQLTKADTQNILASLLTCNETQLNALYSNKKVPIVIKTVIKRLLDDSKVGSIETVEKLWDRIFGKTGLVQALPETQTQQMQGLIPDVPVSREAYILIRDTLIQ